MRMRKNRSVNPGEKFEKLTVLEELPADVRGNIYCLCICDCQLSLPEEEREVRRVLKSSLLLGRVKSCGCIRREMVIKSWEQKTVRNKYDLETYDYGVGIMDNTGNEFYFDIEDYEIIRKYHWLENDQEYVIARIGVLEREKDPSLPQNIRMHRLIMSAKKGQLVDHINHNPKDNRKSNLRFSNKQLNGINRPENVNNKLGVKGVIEYKTKNMPMRYIAKIMKDGKNIDLGIFNTIEDASEARRKAEIELFGEFAYAK